MALQDAFYIIGIIYMSIMLLLIIAILVAILAIRAKIHAIQQSIEERIDAILAIPRKGAAIFNNVRESFSRGR